MSEYYIFARRQSLRIALKDYGISTVPARTIYGPFKNEDALCNKLHDLLNSEEGAGNGLAFEVLCYEKS